MIIIDIIDGGERERRYSDAGMRLRQIETDAIYDDAVDVVPCAYTYEETDQPVQDYEIEDSEALRIITGVSE